MIALSLLATAAVGEAATGVFTAQQYQKALWLTTRYFGAVRSGTGPNWATQDSRYPTSFVKDAYKGADVSGGWFDCGDHVMFGQTQFYAAYVLAKGFASWRHGFPDHYTGDYSDYKQSQDYSMAGGKANGLQDVLEELRYEADFFVKITPSGSDFVYQKGEGTPDHRWWVHSGRMSTMPVAEGGEKEGSRKIFGGADFNDASMPGQAAAMLAVMARVDPDPIRRATYLQHAKNAYAFSKTKSGTAAAPGGFYGANKGYLDARLNAAAELWLTTGESVYQTEGLAIANNSALQFNSGWRMDYENDEPLAMLNAKYVLGANLGTSNERDILKWLQSIWSAAPTGVSRSFVGGFPIRGISGYAFLTALYSTMSKDKTRDQFIYNQLDYMLGTNSNNQAYLVGWDEASKKSPTHPHIRNYYLNEDTLQNTPGKVGPAAKTKYLGAMVGGALDGSYNTDIVNDLSMNEPCAEMNAPVAAVFGYVASQVAPVDTTKFGNVTSITGRSRSTVSLRTSASSIGQVFTSSEATSLEVLTSAGQSVWNGRFENGSAAWTRPAAPGLYLAVARDAQGLSSVVRFVRD
jgi:endoglucanase